MPLAFGRLYHTFSPRKTLSVWVGVKHGYDLIGSLVVVEITMSL